MTVPTSVFVDVMTWMLLPAMSESRRCAIYCVVCVYVLVYISENEEEMAVIQTGLNLIRFGSGCLN